MSSRPQKRAKRAIPDSWSIVASDKSKRTVNPIRAIVDNIVKKDNPEKTMIPLSLGDPTVFGNFNPPEVLVEAVVRAVRSAKHNGYISAAGTPAARSAIAKFSSHKSTTFVEQDVIIASGCSGALEIAITALLNPGDNMLVPNPGFALYQVICESHGAGVKFYDLSPEHGWTANIEQMESLIDEHTKAILINNPSNPCGSVFSKDHLQEMVALAEKHKLPIVADEIYGEMVFKGATFHPLSSISTTVPVVSVGGLAKQFVVPGWRVGWIVIHDPLKVLDQVRAGMMSLSNLIIGANAIVQAAIPDVLCPEPGSNEEAALKKFERYYVGTLEEHASLTCRMLAQVPGLNVVVPQGAMYVMIQFDPKVLHDIKDDMHFTELLLAEEAVFVLPGKCFGVKNCFRVVFSAPKEKLEEAYGRIAQFCVRHAQQ